MISAAPPISFELVTESGFPLGGERQWIELFAKMEQTSVRIRQARVGDRENLQNLGTEDQPSYSVVGILTGRNRLRLPGGEFSLADRSRIEAWIQNVHSEGAAGPTRQTTVFGLTEAQLVVFHEKLARPASCATKGRRAGDVARDIVKGLECEYSVSETARRGFNQGDLVGDELQGLASGMVLAATVRPLGLVIRPENAGKGKTRLLICGVRETEEAWPIGWPPQNIPGKAAPKLFEYLKVTIQNQPLTTATAVVAQRVELPFVWDYNSMARQRIDPANIKVSYTKDRDTYQRILDNVLFQAGLRSELRVDEAGNPFLWISTR